MCQPHADAQDMAIERDGTEALRSRRVCTTEEQPNNN
jgi:hypothetical protein